MRRAHEVDLIEAAARLRVGYYVAHRWVLQGRLKGERREGRWFVDAADLERLRRDLVAIRRATHTT